jgi:hypothetical protein
MLLLPLSLPLALLLLLFLLLSLRDLDLDTGVTIATNYLRGCRLMKHVRYPRSGSASSTQNKQSKISLHSNFCQDILT